MIRKFNRAVRIDQKNARETASNRQIKALKNSEKIIIAHFNILYKIRRRNENNKKVSRAFRRKQK
jgi:hypothetical protein